MAARGELAGQTALVTGVTGAIGGAVAIELGNRGAHILGAVRTNEKGSDFLKVMDGHDISASYSLLDLADTESVADFAERKIPAETRIYVSAAGITRDNLELRMSDDDWGDVMQVNLEGPRALGKAAAKHMFKGKYGRIVYVSSVVGLTGNPGQTNYATSKAGLFGLTKAQAKEYGSRGVTVNAIAPGYVVSAMTEPLGADVKQTMIDHTPIKRSIEPEEVAYAVAALVSPRASAITAEILRVDGGLAA